MDALTGALLILLLGFGLRYWINRRRFHRRIANGLEAFPNYEKATLINFMERICKLIAFVLIFLGLFLLLSYYIKIKKKENETFAFTFQKIELLPIIEKWDIND